MVVRPTIHAPVGPHVLTWRHYLAMWISLGWGANYLGALALVGSLALLGRWRAAALALCGDTTAWGAPGVRVAAAVTKHSSSSRAMRSMRSLTESPTHPSPSGHLISRGSGVGPA